MYIDMYRIQSSDDFVSMEESSSIDSNTSHGSNVNYVDLVEVAVEELDIDLSSYKSIVVDQEYSPDIPFNGDLKERIKAILRDTDVGLNRGDFHLRISQLPSHINTALSNLADSGEIEKRGRYYYHLEEKP